MKNFHGSGNSKVKALPMLNPVQFILCTKRSKQINEPGVFKRLPYGLKVKYILQWKNSVVKAAFL